MLGQLGFEERLELLAIDRGIRRVGIRLTQADFNKIGHAKWHALKLDQCHTFEDNEANRLINGFMKDYYKVIRDVYTYRHHLEAFEVMLEDFDAKSGHVHVYDELVHCLKYECEDQLVYSKKKMGKIPKRYVMVSNFLASQISAPYSGYAREWGAEPDSLPYLSDNEYQKAAKQGRYCRGSDT